MSDTANSTSDPTVGEKLKNQAAKLGNIRITIKGFTCFAIINMSAFVLVWRTIYPTAVDDKQLDFMINVLFATGIAAIVNWAFGSSEGSWRKDDMKHQEELTKLQPPTSPPTQS